jgi:hypothetical protein
MAGTCPAIETQFLMKGLAAETAAAAKSTAAAEAATAISATAATKSATGSTCRTPAAARSTATARSGHARLEQLGLAWKETFALQFLARQLAGPADCFRLLTCALFGGLFIMAAKLHFAENSLALHLLLERLEGLIDVIVTNENLHAVPSPSKLGC